MTAWTDAITALAPAGWWRLGEPSGTTMTDTSGNARHGTYSGSTITLAQTGSMAWDANTAANFAGTNPLGQVTGAAWMDNSVFSVVVVFKVTGTLAAANVLTARDTQSLGRRFQVSLNATGQLLFTVINTATTANSATTAGSYTTGWHLAVCTYDAAAPEVAGDRKLSVYMDGGTLTAEQSAANTINVTGTPGYQIGNAARTAQTPANALIDEVVYLPGVRLSSAQAAALYTAWTTAPTPPGVPTSVAATPAADQITLTWGPPATGDPPISYDVRIDGGTPTTGVTSPHVFTGLSPVTGYTVEVRAVGPGGSSAWVSVVVSTLSAAAYVAHIRVGAHTWTCTAGDDADPDVVNVLAGATFTWAAPDDAGWPPPLHVVDRDVLTLRLAAPDAGDVGDVARGDVVRFKFIPAGYGTTPLVDFAGRVKDVKIVDRDAGGVFLQLTAADHTVTLQDWTVGGETFICADGDTRQEVLDRISYVLDLLNTSYPIDWVPGGFGSVLASVPASAMGTLGYLDTVAVDVTIGADEQTTAAALFALFGMNMFPVPNYDDTTGDLDPTHPFLISYMSTVGQYDIPMTVDACLVPLESVEWRRGYTPNVMEMDVFGQYHAGMDVGAPLPPYERWNLTRANEADVNLGGFTAEVAEPGPWGPYLFTVLGWRDPTTVAGWLTIPSRYQTYVTVDNVAAGWNPNGDTAVSGMLKGCTWSIRENGHWVIDAGIRRHRGIGETYNGTWDGADPNLAWDEIPATTTWDTWT